MHLEWRVNERHDESPRQSSLCIAEALKVAREDARGHAPDEDEGGRDGETFEVRNLAGAVLWLERDCRVEAREAGNAAADEGRQDEDVGSAAQAECEAQEGGGDAERDLGDRRRVNVVLRVREDKKSMRLTHRVR